MYTNSMVSFIDSYSIRESAATNSQGIPKCNAVMSIPGPEIQSLVILNFIILPSSWPSFSLEGHSLPTMWIGAPFPPS